MFVRHRAHHRMIHAVEHVSILAIAGAMIGKTHYESFPPFLLPAVKQPSQLTVRIPQRRSMSLPVIVLCSLQIKVIGIMDGTYI